MTEADASFENDNETFTINDFDLWVLMDRARMTIGRTSQLEVASHGLTIEQAGILDELLRGHGSATIAEIVNATGKQYNSVTTLVNRMVKNGLVEKKRNGNSGRYLILMTDKGKEMYGKLTRNAIEMAFSDLTMEEKQMLFNILKKLLKRGRKMLGVDFKLPFLPA
jgi:DNA-binding MarR family transcriptional regulator